MESVQGGRMVLIQSVGFTCVQIMPEHGCVDTGHSNTPTMSSVKRY